MITYFAGHRRPAGLWPQKALRPIGLAFRYGFLFATLLLPGVIVAQSGSGRAGVKVIVDSDISTNNSLDRTKEDVFEPRATGSLEQTRKERPGVPVRWSKTEGRWKPISAREQSGDTAIYLLTPPEEQGEHRQQYAAMTKTERSRARNAQTRVLVHWNKRERRWEPVSAAEMRAARRAVQEVAIYMFLPLDQGANRNQRLKREPAAPVKHEAASSNGKKPMPESLASRKMPAQPLPPAVEAEPSRQPIAAVKPDLPPAPASLATVKPRASSVTIDEVIREAAARHGVDPDLVRAVIRAESNFNSHAVSKKGAMGLMQLTPETARKLKVKNPFDAAENVDAGVRHLKSLLSTYNGDVSRSLAAYNAGPGAVARAKGVPNIRETRNYVKQITQMYWNPPVKVSAPGSSGGSARPVPFADSSAGVGAPLVRTYRASNGVLMISDQ